MSKFKITVTTEMHLPDDFDIWINPKDGFLYLKRGTDCFYPTMSWMIRTHYLLAGLTGQYESAPTEGSVTVGTEDSELFMEAGTQDETYEIESI